MYIDPIDPNALCTDERWRREVLAEYRGDLFADAEDLVI